MTNIFETKVSFTESLVTDKHNFRSVSLAPLDELGDINALVPIRAINSITQLFQYSGGTCGERHLTKGYLAIIDGKLNHLEIKIDTNYPLDMWDMYGQFYGFPMCCIANFINRPIGSPHLPVDHPFSQTGFVPCPKCLERDYTDLIEEIKSKRFFSKPFTEKGLPSADISKIPELVNFLINHYQPKNFESTLE